MQFLSTNEIRYYQYTENQIAQFLTEKGPLGEHMKLIIHAQC